MSLRTPVDGSNRANEHIREARSLEQLLIAYETNVFGLISVTLLTAQALGEKVNALAPGLRLTNLIPGMPAGGDPARDRAPHQRFLISDIIQR